MAIIHVNYATLIRILAYVHIIQGKQNASQSPQILHVYSFDFLFFFFFFFLALLQCSNCFHTLPFNAAFGTY